MPAYYLCRKLETTVSPMTICFDEVTRFISEILAWTKTLRMSRWGGSGGCVGCRRRWFPLNFSGGPPRGSIGFGCHRARRWFRCFPAWLYALYIKIREVLTKYFLMYIFSIIQMPGELGIVNVSACNPKNIFLLGRKNLKFQVPINSQVH